MIRMVERKRSPDHFGNSSWIRGGRYLPEPKGWGTMILNMKGKNYTFTGVNKGSFTRLARTGSKGGYYHRNLRGKYYDPRYLPGVIQYKQKGKKPGDFPMTDIPDGAPFAGWPWFDLGVKKNRKSNTKKNTKGGTRKSGIRMKSNYRKPR